MEEEANKTFNSNPWHHREDFPSVRETRLIPMAILFLLACFSFPLAAVRIAPFVLAPILIGGMGWLTWKRRGGLWLTLVVAAVAAPVSVWGASLGFLILAASAGAFSGAYLFTVQGRPYLPAVSAAVAFAISFALTRNAATASLSFVLLPAVFLLGGAVLLGERRVTVVAAAMLGFVLSLGCVALWYIIRRGGSLNVATILTIADEWKASMTAFLTKQAEAAFSTLQTGTGNSAQMTAMLKEMFSPETIKTYVDSIFNLIPAFLLIACEIPAFLAQKLLIGAYTTNRLGAVVGLEAEFFAVGVPTAVIWSAAFLLSFFGAPTTNLFFAVTENLRYLLMPALFVVGVRTTGRLYLHANSGSKAFFWVAGIALLCCSPATLLSLLGLFGAYETIMRAIRRALLRKLEGPPRGDDDRDDG